MLWLISLNIFHSYDWKMQAHERVECTMEETTTELSSLDSQNNPSHLKRASTEKLREIFNRYASKEINGEKYMTSEDFVRKYLGLFPDQDFNEVRNARWYSWNVFFFLSRANFDCRNPYFFSEESPTPTRMDQSRSQSFKLSKDSFASLTHYIKLHFNFSIRMEMEMFHFVSLHCSFKVLFAHVICLQLNLLPLWRKLSFMQKFHSNSMDHSQNVS